MGMRATNTTKDATQRHVNDMLDTLRGEHYRHTQNVSRARRVPPSTGNRTAPNLPFFLEYYSSAPAPKRQSGPPPPRSWTQSASVTDTPNWRASRLAPVFACLPEPSHTDDFPPLARLCLRSLLSLYTTDELIEEVAPLLPGHLRRLLVRDAAIHAPFSTAQLLRLGGEEGHIEDELVIVGPAAGLREDHAVRLAQNARTFTTEKWDADDDAGAQPLQSLVILSARLTSSALLKLPPSLTHLALINLPDTILLYRLPSVCPLLVFLDLSHNSWLNEHDRRVDLMRVDWTRWTQLKRLVLRGCYVPHELPAKVNKSRWDDVAIIQE
ncbi:hypothetical protein BD626DRAFT_569809 [Schizophyllum amplum]|uniref:Uncharacterized protein n=1 Tax=Schizophyllum amplum TaxID=97359 RepID=A0A550CCY7_9AGAR|nr:hypothetical protein BD626DRAFT_569809 [Auriculariopsis ampla]